VAITGHFKVGIEELAAVLPPKWAKLLLAWGERTGRLGRSYFSMHLRSTTILGLMRLRLIAGLRSYRPNTYRFAEEQREIDRWLEQIRTAGRTNVGLAREIAECARLIEGSDDAHKHGLANYRRINAEVIEPALARRMTPRAAADAVASARVAALADPEGETLSKTLAAIAAASPVLRHAAE
jgi:indolepyruvate ferredoxin oxidoreductase beta subunit